MNQSTHQQITVKLLTDSILSGKMGILEQAIDTQFQHVLCGLFGIDFQNEVEYISDFVDMHCD